MAVDSIKIAELFGELGIKVSPQTWTALANFKSKLTDIKSAVDGIAARNVTIKSAGLNGALSKIKELRKELNAIRAETNIKANVSGRIYGGGSAGYGRVRGVDRYSDMFAGGAAGSALSRMGLPVAGGAAAAFSFQEIYQSAKSMNQLRLSIIAASGSAEEGAKQYRYFEDTAMRLGTDLRQGGTQFASLLATTQAMNMPLEQAQKTFTAVASASRVLGLSAEGQEGALRAITQILSKGKVMSEELKGQLAERIPGAVAMAADAMQMSVPELFKAMEGGLVDSATFIPKFTAELQKFSERGGALALALKHPSYYMQIFMNRLVLFSERIFNGGIGKVMVYALMALETALDIVEPPLTLFIEAIGYLGDKLYQTLKPLKELNDATGGWLANIALLAVAFRLLAGVGIIAWLTTFFTTLAGVVAWMGAGSLLAGAGLFLLVASGLALLGLALQDLWMFFTDSNAKTVIGTWLKETFGTTRDSIITYWSEVIDSTVNVFRRFADNIKAIIENITFGMVSWQNSQSPVGQTRNPIPTNNLAANSGHVIQIDKVYADPNAGLLDKVLGGIALMGQGVY